MNDDVRIVTVDATNVAEERFFCYKSKPKSEGHRRKLAWLEQRFAEGMVLKILHEGVRSVGFIEYLPGEYAWRAVHAPGHLLIHCLWVVGKAKKKGYASRLLAECEADARRQGKAGVAMVTSRGNWLAGPKILRKNGFEMVDQAPPSFELLVKRFVDAPRFTDAARFADAPLPTFPQDWARRAAECGPGMTIFRTDQCPYIENATNHAIRLAEELGLEARVVDLQDRQQMLETAPSAYGVFNIVIDGKFFCYTCIGTKEKRELLTLLGRDGI
jgi:ribosomal protein S18 acetylase RimI-like enzyme